MPQFDPFKAKTLDAEEILKALTQALKKLEWRKVEHYATLMALEAAEKQPLST